MTIRRQWLLVLTITAVIAVCVNSVILSSLINRYFSSFNAETYSNHVEQIRQLAQSALSENRLSEQQLTVQFESHLDDPIVSINLYNADGKLVASAETTGYGRNGMMNGMQSGMPGMMNGKMHRSSEEVDSFNISGGGAVLGVLNITRYSSLNNSMVSAMFRTSLLRNSVLSFGIVLAVLIVIGIFVSRRLSRDLTNTASQALSVDMGGKMGFRPSRVKEIRIIQSGLETLQSRLKLKRVGRKRIVDELVHQTRTPLTILKTHLEGLEDGVITMSGDEIKVCQAQIDSISSIISNMSMLLDAGKTADTIHPEEFEVHALLSQIVGGLRVQFEKKKIGLKLTGNQKLTILSDRNKLSQSIYNVLTNAYKFTEHNGTVDINYEASDTTISIRIKDTGAGIAGEDLPHLFDAYYRGHNAAATAGEGLGLYVAKENLEQLGGTISVNSQLGSGSEFVISLPIKLTQTDAVRGGV